MKTLSLLTFFLLYLTNYSFADWDPDAGLISSYTTHAKIDVSSGDNFSAIIDGDRMTYWESTSPLPEKYIDRSNLNFFLSSSKYLVDNQNITASNAFDGILSSKSEILSGRLSLDLIKSETISLLSVKLFTQEPVKITIASENNIWEYFYLPEDNYGLKSFELPERTKVKSIKLECIDSFSVFEIAGLYNSPTEEVIFDLNENKAIGWIGSRHFNGDGIKSITISVSSDKVKWKHVANLNPMATAYVDQLIVPEVVTRYVKVSFLLKGRNYQKAKLHEFEIYDRFGPYGKPNTPHRADKTYSESFGVNAIWGWGYSVSSDKLPARSGPQLFNGVGKLVRNYHSISWDIKLPGQNPDYAGMKSGKGTSATEWMNWYSEYNTWQKAGLSNEICLMFNNNSFPDTLWKNPVEESYQFGKYFGNFFIRENKLTSIVEIGNEPWEYSKTVYRDILSGMSRGLKESMGSATILPCATQAFSKSNSNDNYISEYITAGNSANLSGLSTHLYSYTFDYNGKRTAVNPEDPRSETWSVNNMMRFSQSNLNSKPVYVTEFGFDSHGGGDDCTHDVCVSEMEQAIYGSRMALILYRLGVEEFYWYYFANVDYQSMLHNRSGLLSSYSKGFSKKLSFNAFEVLQKELGSYYFHSIILENEDAYVYAYCDKSGKVKRIIAWRPTSENHLENEWIDIPSSYVVRNAVALVDHGTEVQYVRKVKNLKINLNGVPVIIDVE